jgi:heme/copper-type cytochrome/quinol oxidase subunit 3
MSATTSTRQNSDLVPASTRHVNKGLLGAAVFIVSESAFFLGLFLAHFYLLAQSGIGSPFAPGQPRPSPLLPLINTLVMAVSVGAMVWAERGIARGDQRRLTVGMSVAAALGLVFMAFQSIEFAGLIQLGLAPVNSSFGSTFFALMVFHVLRVFAGVTFMVIVLIRALLGQFSQRRRSVVQACALYWYFIATVWVAVFVVLYGT